MNQVQKDQDPRRTRIPEATWSVLDNGLQVVVVPGRSNPYLTAHLLLPAAGGLADPPGREGLAAFCAQMLRHGTRLRTEQELSETLDQAGARLGASVYLDYVDVGGDVPTFDPGDVDTFFTALAEVLIEPCFPEAETEKVRSLRAGNLRAIADQNDQLIARAFEAVVFSGHPLGRPVSGTLEALRSIGRDDLLSFHSLRYRPGSALLGIAGDISVQEALERARRHFGAWDGAAGPALQIPELPPEPEGVQVTVVDKRDAGLTQVHLRVGHRTPLTLQSPELFQYRLATQVLGGDFTARLNQRLRVKEGLTYGARYTYRLSSQLLGTSGVATYVELPRLGAALEQTFQELERFSTEGAEERELAEARDKLVLGFPFRFETPASTLEQHLWVAREGLPPDFLPGYQERLDRVSCAQVNRSAACHFPGRRAAQVVAVATSPAADALARQLGDGARLRVISLEELGL